MPELLDLLAAGLERPRELPVQVVHHLTNTHGVDRDAVGGFLTTALPQLEEYEVDLILSPVFTPALAEQAPFAEWLGRDSVARERWPALVEELVARPTRAALITSDGLSHVILLQAVTVERYVFRLRLDGTIPEPLFQLIQCRVPAVKHPMVKAIARRAAWATEGRRQILARVLAADPERCPLDDLVGLLNLVESYQPADSNELLGRLPQWEQVLRQEIQGAGNPKPFFNERVQDLHGGGRDQRRPDEIRQAARAQELAALGRLGVLLRGPQTDGPGS